jgi:iron-sulfur cluster insertion protein
MITITDNAATKIKDIVIDEKNDALKLRVFVQGGGCSGMSYGFTLDDEQNDEDFVIQCYDISILIDAASMNYLRDSTIDYVDDIQGSSFSISNPNAQTTCGCGSSFTPNNMEY